MKGIRRGNFIGTYLYGGAYSACHRGGVYGCHRELEEIDIKLASAVVHHFNFFVPKIGQNLVSR